MVRRNSARRAISWYPATMAGPLDEMVASWRRRQAQRSLRDEDRAVRLRHLLPAAKRILCEGHGARRVILFGSLARGDVTERSDVDLAVEGLRSAEYFTAIADLQGLFDSPVDLVEVETASSSLRQRLAFEGIEL